MTLGRPETKASRVRLSSGVGLSVDCIPLYAICCLELVSWCFKPSQQRIISGLKETFIRDIIVERTNKAEIRSEEQSEKAESCLENLWNEIQLKGSQRRCDAAHAWVASGAIEISIYYD